MGQDVDANGRSILHKGHGMTHTCPVPDVCKTPTPGGPVPIPYVNIAMDSDITDGAETVKIEGNPVANVGAKIATSTGDEAGSAGGGIISSKIKGTVTWKMGSLNVKAEGKSVVRFLDQNFHNGNSFNTSFKALGGTGMAYGDDFEGDCPVCEKPSDKHKILATKSSAAKCAKIIEYLQNEFKNAKSDEARVAFARWDFNDSGEKVWSGYMVGVMICACPKPMSFAAMSGKGGLRGFKAACTAATIDVVIGGGSKAGGQPRSVKWQDLVKANTSKTVSREKLKEVVEKRWKTRREGSPRAGSCAGQHLLARSNHGPVAMTEMWFAPPGGAYWGQIYSFRKDGRAIKARFGPDVPETDETPWGSTVGSCKTCQDLLFLTMCPERVCQPKK